MNRFKKWIHEITRELNPNEYIEAKARMKKIEDKFRNILKIILLIFFPIMGTLGIYKEMYDFSYIMFGMWMFLFTIELLAYIGNKRKKNG